MSDEDLKAIDGRYEENRALYQGDDAAAFRQIGADIPPLLAEVRRLGDAKAALEKQLMALDAALSKDKGADELFEAIAERLGYRKPCVCAPIHAYDCAQNPSRTALALNGPHGRVEIELDESLVGYVVRWDGGLWPIRRLETVTESLLGFIEDRAESTTLPPIWPLGISPELHRILRGDGGAFGPLRGLTMFASNPSRFEGIPWSGLLPGDAPAYIIDEVGPLPATAIEELGRPCACGNRNPYWDGQRVRCQQCADVLDAADRP